MSGSSSHVMAKATQSDGDEGSVADEKKPQIPQTAHPTFLEAFRFWLKLGFISFGGPTGQIAIMHHELVAWARCWQPASRLQRF